MIDSRTDAVPTESSQGCESDQPSGHRRRLSVAWLLLMVLMALGVRMLWLHTHAWVIENEGAEYARIAENLRHGKGYQGTMDGPQLIFPPLYPLVIAGASFLTRDFELAARLVCLLSGTLLVVPVMLLADRHYGRTTAIVAGLLTAFYPHLIALSASTYSECLYTTLLLSGIYAGFHAVQLLGIRYYLLTGIFFGLAYLTRPEALGYVLIIGIGTFLLAWKHHVRPTEPGRALLLISGCALLLAFPYIFYLHQHTGHWRLEGKSEVNYALGERLNSGMDGWQAAFGLGAHGEIEGPLLDPNSWIGHTGYPKNPLRILRFMRTSAKNNLRVLYYRDVSPLLWIPCLFLSVLGLVRQAWRPARAEREVFLLGMFAFAAIPIVVGPVFSQYRFVLPLIPLLLIWSAEGLRELGRWGADTISALLPDTPLPTVVYGTVPVIGSVVLLLLCAWTAPQAQIFKEQGTQVLYLKQAGLWLRSHGPEGKRIMCGGTAIPYYSGGVWIPMPYAMPPAVVNYMHQTGVNIIVLNDFGRRPPGDLEGALKQAGAELLYDAGAAAKPRILIYKVVHDTLSRSSRHE